MPTMEMTPAGDVSIWFMEELTILGRGDLSGRQPERYAGGPLAAVLTHTWVILSPSPPSALPPMAFIP